MHFDAPVAEAFRNQVGRLSLFVPQFGMCVNGSSEGLDFAVSGLDFGDQFHGALCFAVH